jgi:hypothetical protein
VDGDVCAGVAGVLAGVLCTGVAGVAGVLAGVVGVLAGVAAGVLAGVAAGVLRDEVAGTCVVGPEGGARGALSWSGGRSAEVSAKALWVKKNDRTNTAAINTFFMYVFSFITMTRPLSGIRIISPT